MHSNSIRIVSWQDETPALRLIRETVFILEQHVPEELEWDAFDDVSVHVLAFSPDGKPVGTARLLPDGHIGRMAVLKEWRMMGFGSAMLRRLLHEAHIRGIKKVILNAQTTAVQFYERFGFQPVGEEFMDAGIPHVKMTLSL